MEQHPLTAQDRCDRCGAQAQARTMHDSGPLLWCRHHLRANEDLLLPHVVYYREIEAEPVTV